MQSLQNQVSALKAPGHASVTTVVNEGGSWINAKTNRHIFVRPQTFTGASNHFMNLMSVELQNLPMNRM